MTVLPCVLFSPTSGQAILVEPRAPLVHTLHLEPDRRFGIGLTFLLIQLDAILASNLPSNEGIQVYMNPKMDGDSIFNFAKLQLFTVLVCFCFLSLTSLWLGTRCAGTPNHNHWIKINNLIKWMLQLSHLS